jgi:hypothetical protein
VQIPSLGCGPAAGGFLLRRSVKLDRERLSERRSGHQINTKYKRK